MYILYDFICSVVVFQQLYDHVYERNDHIEECYIISDIKMWFYIYRVYI